MTARSNRTEPPAGADLDELAQLPGTVPELLALRRGEPDAPLLIGADFSLSHHEADERSALMAQRLLATGVGKSSRVGLLAGNGPSWVVSWLALARVGAETATLSTFSPGSELGRTIDHTEIGSLLLSGAFGDHDLLERLEQAFPLLRSSESMVELLDAPFLRWISCLGDQQRSWLRDLEPSASVTLFEQAESRVVPSDPLVMISTSGTTASPKSVVHTHGSLVRHAALLVNRREIKRSDRLFCPMPFFWVGGLTTVLLAALASGGAVITQERFEAESALDLIETERATQVMLWPNAVHAISGLPSFQRRDLSSVRGGTLLEALPMELRPSSGDLYPGVFGMTETGGPHSNPDDPYRPLFPEDRGSFGRSIPGVERRIVDPESAEPVPNGGVGELHVRGPFVMDRIHRLERHEVFSADGWYATGDLCSIDDAGHLRSHGRLGGAIKSGGSNVSPAEVEASLRGIDGVLDAAVVGAESAIRGQDVAAAVQIDKDSALDEASLSNLLRGLLANFKVPRQWHLIRDGSLPMLPTGKVDYQAVRTFFRQD